jgi:hypothetical protein
MADAELAKLYNDTGIDLSPLPPIMTAENSRQRYAAARARWPRTATATGASPTSRWAGASAMHARKSHGI